MNIYLNEIRSIVVDYHNQLKTQKEILDDLENQYKQGDISKNYYESKKNEIIQDQVSQGEYHTQIDKLAKRYEEQLKNWMIVRGEDLTDDAKLFNSPINLTENEYAELEEKYQENYTMLRAIKEHAATNNVYYPSRYSIDEKEKLQAFKEVIEPAKNALRSLNNGSGSYLAELWGFKDKFEEIYQDVSKITQIGN